MKLEVYNYSFKNSTADVLDVFIDGEIVDAATEEIYRNWFGDETTTSYKSFRQQVLNSTAKRVNIHVNSGGGQVADALAIHDFIIEEIHNGRDMNTYGKGLVASAATYILLAPGKDRSHMSSNCFFMIHNVSGRLQGDVNQIESGARVMRKFNDCARDLYASYFGQTTDQITQWMNEETWWTGNDMKDLGFLTNVGPAVNAITNAIPKEKWLFNNTAILNTINNSILPPKNKGMKKNKILNAIATAFANLKLSNDTQLSTVNVDQLRNALTAALEAEGEDDTDVAAITNAVTAALTPEILNAAVTNAFAAMTTVPANITTAITNATNGLAKTTDVVNKTEFEELKTDLADKLGTPRNKGRLDNETPDGPKNRFNHDGITIED